MVLTDYARLLRPSVLRQLNPDVVRLVNALPAFDRQNKATLGQLFVHAGLAHAKRGADGRMRATVRVPPGAEIWKPSVIVMPGGGDLELELVNDDPYAPHCAVLPNNGDKQWIWLPIYSRGTATLNLDGPGLYWFSSALANNEGRGLIAAIVVLGDVPQEARLDRPPQPRP
jgi:PQQ system protein